MVELAGTPEEGSLETSALASAVGGFGMSAIGVSGTGAAVGMAAARFPAPPPPEKELKRPTDVTVELLSTMIVKRLRNVCSWTPEATTAARLMDSVSEMVHVESASLV